MVVVVTSAALVSQSVKPDRLVMSWEVYQEVPLSWVVEALVSSR